MIAGSALAAWLADRGSQERSHESVEACARHWSRQPLMTQLERELAQIPDKSAHAVLDAARSFMDRTGETEALIADMIASSRIDPFFRPPFHPISSEIHSGLLLYHGADLSIALGVTGADMLAAKKTGRQGPASIAFTGVTTLFRYLKSGEATLSFWEAPPISGAFVSSAARRARMTDRRRIRDGEEVVIDGRYQSFVIEHAASDMVYFEALIRPEAAPLAVEYDSQTHEFVGASSTDEASSRLQMMVSVLRAMDRHDAIPLMIEALGSRHFYTRWHIMRELLAMDAEAAEQPLRRMAQDDPHPEVRAAARETLHLFFDAQTAAA